MRVLVTGGCGFIGSHAAEALVAAGHEVRVLDNLSTGSLANLGAVADHVEMIREDIRNYEAVAAAMEDVDRVLHLAAMVSVTDSVARPLDNHAVNVTGTLHVLEAARKAGARRVVAASSCAVYGDTPELPKQENMIPCPASPYGLSKLCSEQHLAVFSSLYGLETVSLRFFNVYGPRQDPAGMYAGVIARFVEAAVTGASPFICGDGLQTRDFVYVKDVVRAVLQALEGPGLGSGEVVNVGSGRSISILDLVGALSRAAGRELTPVHGDSRPGDVRHSLADITRARKLLGFQPGYPLTQGLSEILTERTPSLD
ncbi:MAG: SDR family oxidoreductase [Proteobacteria bacterium]|nr:SDR family oxidoreductase [Pseudomonadota bacterium]